MADENPSVQNIIKNDLKKTSFKNWWTLKKSRLKATKYNSVMYFPLGFKSTDTVQFKNTTQLSVKKKNERAAELVTYLNEN